MSVGNGHHAQQNSSNRSLNLGEVREFLFCFAFLASTPGLYRKKCKACQHDNHFNSKKCKRCGGALDIQSPGRGRGTTDSESYGVSVVHVTCYYAMNRATPSTRLQVQAQVRRPRITITDCAEESALLCFSV